MVTGVPARLSAKEGRKFAFTVGAAFLVLAAVLWWRGRSTSVLIVGGLGVTLNAAGLVIPGQLGPVYRAWMGLAHLLSRITTPVFLGVIYFGIITFVGWVMRLFGRNPLTPRLAEKTAWQVRNADNRRSALDHQF